MKWISNSDIVYENESTYFRSCDDYLYGYCHLFAIGLKEVFQERAKIEVVWQHENDNMDDYGFLAHAYVVIDDNYIIDCRGVINQDIILSEYIEDSETSYLLDNAEKEIYLHMSEFLVEPFQPNEKEQIIDFIEKNYCFYDKSC